MNNQQLVTASRALSDLELYELMVAAYPEKFADRDENGDDLWDEVMDFADELCTDMDQDVLCKLLGRIVMLTMPAESPLSGTISHALGTTQTGADGKSYMMAAVSRVIKIEGEPTQCPK